MVEITVQDGRVTDKGVYAAYSITVHIILLREYSRVPYSRDLLLLPPSSPLSPPPLLLPPPSPQWPFPDLSAC